MSENTNTTDLARIVELKAELLVKERAAKALAKQEEWEKKTKARNPQYVMGSLRRGSDVAADKLPGGHCHGMVCLIKCTDCGKVRMINKQDAFQCRFCKDCKKEASKKAAKERRQAKQLAEADPTEIQARIAELNDLLAAKQGTKAKTRKATKKAG